MNSNTDHAEPPEFARFDAAAAAVLLVLDAAIAAGVALWRTMNSIRTEMGVQFGR